MPIRSTSLSILLLVLVSAVVFLIGETRAAETSKQQASHASLLKRSGESPVLLIDYPWKAHQRPSVELRRMTKTDKTDFQIRPLFFTSEYFKGEMTDSVYRCQDAAAGVPLIRSREEKGVVFDILGRRNKLGRPSVCVVRPTPPKEPATGTAAVFCLLEPWSLGKQLLHLEPPSPWFDSPGTLYVWMLRDEKIVWQQQIAWPGKPKKKP